MPLRRLRKYQKCTTKPQIDSLKELHHPSHAKKVKFEVIIPYK
ncbi:844_t:CDS:2 [Entrophospora sp. SA101]|nr:844_t:CDS:2 [Entrophospora sp. SA101]